MQVQQVYSSFFYVHRILNKTELMEPVVLAIVADEKSSLYRLLAGCLWNY